MKKVVKHWEKPVREFVCGYCKCEFCSDEYKEDHSIYKVVRFFEQCPQCKKKAVKIENQ